MSTNSSRRSQSSRKRDPGGAVKNQINADKEADHPEAGRGPLRKDEPAQH